MVDFYCKGHNMSVCSEDLLHYWRIFPSIHQIHFVLVSLKSLIVESGQKYEEKGKQEKGKILWFKIWESFYNY